jgi:hypothetical protein
MWRWFSLDSGISVINLSRMKRLAAVLFLLTTLEIFATPEPQIGAVLRHGDNYDISVIFSEPVNVSALDDPENYDVTPGNILALRLCATNQGVILTVGSLSAGMDGVLSIKNMLDPFDNPVPAASLEFKTGARLWAYIGANELGFPYDVVGFPTNGFDLFSGGVQQMEEYDDAVFMGGQITGDFEAKVRVEYVEPAGRGSKAGIMIREQLDEGRPRPVDPFDPAQAFSRYVELAVSNPVSILGEPSPGHQIWQRAVSPGTETLSLTVTNQAAPDFTNAWVRIERAGQQFTMSRSSDGKNWQQIGGATFNPPLSTNVYVGLAFTPQNSDVPPETGFRRTFLAQFREYELIPKESGDLRIATVGDHAEVTWAFGWILQTALAVTGPWSQAPSQTSPLRVNFSEQMRFYRLSR